MPKTNKQIIIIRFYLFTFLTLISNSLLAHTSTASDKSKEEVLENPTLKTLSGSLRRYSFYSSFTYRGASLSTPLSAERPNILDAEETPGLVNLSGNLGVKFRLTKTDNLSLQTGLFATTPFHNSIDTDNSRNKRDFEENGNRYDLDNPTLRYFKTYMFGKFQNITFLSYQYVTRGSFRDLGYRDVWDISQASAYRISKAFYIAGSLNYRNFQYDSNKMIIGGKLTDISSRQTHDTLKASLNAEYYLKRNIAFRFIVDIASYFRTRRSSDIERRDLQQTIAMTYFFNRDISIAPNIRFVSDDIRSDRTNIGFTMNLNI